MTVTQVWRPCRSRQSDSPVLLSRRRVRAHAGESPEVAAESSTTARVRIELAASWDASLSYGVLEQDAEAPAPIFVGRDTLLDSIVNAFSEPERRGDLSGCRGG